MKKTSLRKVTLFVIGFLVLTWIMIFVLLRNPSFTPRSSSAANLFNPEVLETHVRFFTSQNPNRSVDHPKSMFQAEDYIKKQFEAAGYKVKLQDVPAEDQTYHNLIVRYGDENAKEVIVVGAHYDACGPDNPGADDNASGVAVLLELAKQIQIQKPKIDTAIEFVAYTLEEPPYYGTKGMGSSLHADSLKKENINVKYMISLEMLGYYSNELFSQKFPLRVLYAFYPWAGNFLAVVTGSHDRELTRNLKDSLSEIMAMNVYTINAPSFVRGIDFSDHRNYWVHDWPAFMLTDTAFLRNKEYHEPGDTPDRLNYGKMADIGQGLYSTLLQGSELLPKN